MQLDLFMAGADEVVHDMRRRKVTLSTAEPLVAGKALDDACGVVYATVAIKGVSLQPQAIGWDETYAHA